MPDVVQIQIQIYLFKARNHKLCLPQRALQSVQLMLDYTTQAQVICVYLCVPWPQCKPMAESQWPCQDRFICPPQYHLQCLSGLCWAFMVITAPVPAQAPRQEEM